ncbi:hypothetical protein ACOZB4_05805 [Paenibacillus sp. NPDC058898]|uniref:hypothetical protein n=1 Tax=Paenibacillus sp. NPDC058898 TaxID=3346669 RepID=UPI003BF48CC5
MARRVVPGHAVRLSSCPTARRIHEATDRPSASASRLRQCFPTSVTTVPTSLSPAALPSCPDRMASVELPQGQLLFDVLK